MGNLLLDHATDFVKKAQDRLLGVDEHYSIFGPEPTERPKNYRTDDGYKAIVQDNSSFDLIILFKDGQIHDMQEIPF